LLHLQALPPPRFRKQGTVPERITKHMGRNGMSRRGFIVKAIASSTSLLALERARASETNSVQQDAIGNQPHSAKNLSWSDNDGAAHPQFSAFSEIPLQSIEPEGWLKAYLTRQKNGITGHLDETGGFPFNTYGWAGPGISDVPKDLFAYEQTGYWVDGMIRCGYLLHDADLIQKATNHTNYVLQNPDKDGYLGPVSLKTETRWPHVVFFRALSAQCSATADQNIPASVKRHFLSSPYPHTKEREACSIEAILWAYEHDKDPALLRLAIEIFRNFETSFDVNGVSPATYLDGKPSNAHGVTYNEMAKLGALLYMETGNEDYLRVSVEAYKKIDAFHMLADGVHSSSEEMRKVTSLESHETCDISDYTWSVGYLLMATGRADYADKIERACFNAAPGAVSADFTSLQYFSCPNQVIAAHNTNHNIYFRGDRTMAFATAHIAACCSGNVNRVMPNFASRLWMRDADNGLVAALYAPSKVTYRVGRDRREVTITENTRYPFSTSIEFAMNMEHDTHFPFTVRVPRWCKGASIQINGKPIDGNPEAGTFVKINRKFSDGDVVAVTLPQEIKATSWPSNGIVLERGPIVYALKIDEEWELMDKAVESCIGEIGVYNLKNRYPGLLGNNVYPKSPWNYALDIDLNNASAKAKLSEKEWSDENPWSANDPPILLEVPARRLVGWELDRKQEIVLEGGIDDPGLVPIKGNSSQMSRKGSFVFTPDLPTSETSGLELESSQEMVTLVPYGCARLRVTVFPTVSGVKTAKRS
jgi:uncharacterized protein